MACLELLPDGVEDLTVLLARDRHDGAEIIEPLGLGEIIGFLHASFVATEAAFPAFLARSERTQGFHEGLVVVRGLDQIDLVAIVALQVKEEAP